MTMGKQIYYHNLRENIKNMNTKFKDIAIKAGAYPDGDTVLIGPMDTAKFAELIVAECIDAVEKTNRHHAHTTFDLGLIENTIEKSVKAIKEHFYGIES